jgi:hypothetical protein
MARLLDRALSGIVLLSAVLVADARPATGQEKTVKTEASGRDRYRWFSVPLHVTGLPKRAEFVPLSCPVDFTRLLQQVGAPGAIDVRSLRLYRLTEGGDEVEEAVQFTAAPQPRPRTRRLLPDAGPGVSYLAEFRVEDPAPVPRTAGELSWVARADGQGQAKYRLRFGMPRAGMLVQVPYPPHDLRAFDADGRATPLHAFPRIQIRPQWPLGGAVHLHADRDLVTSYHLGPTSPRADPPPYTPRRPYFYPVHGPDGFPLTGLGKPHDPTGSHAHHYSLWVADADVGGHNFWGEKGGIIYHKRFDLQEDGPVFCRLVQRTGWAAGGADVLLERRTVTLYRTPDAFRLLDIELEFTPAAAQPLVLGKTSFGFLAVRVAPSLSVFDGGGEIRNARGECNERGAHLRRAEWLDQSGPVAPGKWGGVALLDHSQNPNHPTVWHCRNDGWAGAAFTADGPRTLEPGRPLVLRYRALLHRGDATAGAVARRYQEYASRPSVRLGKPAAE